VPAAGESHYKLNCLGFQPGKHPVQVKFSNLSDGEFVFYNLVIEFTKSDIQDTIPLETMCRQSIKHVISIENPVPAEGKISLPDDWWSCSSDEVRVRELKDLSGPAETNIEVEFRPLCVMRDSKADLTIKCNNLGQYNYALLLSATEAGLERSLNFKAPLGGTQNKIFRFNSLLQKSAPQFECSIGKPLFFSVNPAQYTAEAAEAWEGSPSKVEVMFEPEELGKVQDVLTLTSENGGEYKCTLFGECTPPLPQGPFAVRPGAKEALKLKFKNVFNTRKKFVYAVDHPAFSVSPQGNDINPKDSTNITVSFDASKTDTPTLNGRLLISSPDAPDVPPWVYYLNGLS